MFLISCDRDKLASELPQPSASNTSADVSANANASANAKLENVARALAKSLGENASARGLLKKEALKQFDGDYDVLYAELVKQVPAFGQQMEKTVKTEIEGQVVSGMAPTLRDVPNLNISVPINIDKWDVASYSPLVVFIPAGYNDRVKKQRLKAYDKDGKLHWLDADNAPDFPIIVVGPSERVTVDARGNLQNPKQGSPSDILLPSDPDGGGGGGGGWTPPVSYVRVDKRTEYLKSLWLEDVSEYETYILGKPEIRLQIMAPTGGAGGTSILDVMYTMTRSEIESTWRTNTALFLWDKAVYSNAVGYAWYEQDGGTIADVKLSIGFELLGVKATREVTFKIANDDDRISVSSMHFDFEPSAGGYYTGGTGGIREFRWVLENL
ncbi:DUF3103 family protein [uncultured Hymenobacter sp.]|uniref:DUF3103 family protein n=1 Tax=uncultured Hymenobacter sp. TaxID=170016 RepID=UPI0035CAF3E3